MRRTARLSSSVLVGVMLSAPAGATASAETCQGETATVVGTPGTDLTGTEDRDVIVTNGARKVSALGGDDLVCVTGAPAESAAPDATVAIDAGAGDDAVEAQVPGWRVTGALGTGSDRFVSATDADHVLVTGGFEAGSDTSNDVVLTGAGDDHVDTGARGHTNGDVVDLGAGDDHVEWKGTADASTSLEGGEGRDHVSLNDAEGDVVIDAGEERVTTDGELTVAPHDVEAYTFGSWNDDGSLVFLGTDAADHLEVGAPAGLVQRVQLRGGDDSYTTFGTVGTGVTRGTVSAGAGHDRAELPLDSLHQVALDMRTGRVAVTRHGDTTRARWRQFETVDVSAHHVAVTGTPADDMVLVRACASTLRMGAGDDAVLATFGHGRPGSERCDTGSTQGTQVHAGPGHDLVTGTARPDLLLGGAGWDRLDGRRGRDVCRGEETIACERLGDRQR